MRKRYSVGFLLLTIVVIVLLILVYRFSYHMALLDMQEEFIEEFTDLDDFYFIKENDGYVTVYYADEKTVYEYTSIPLEELPVSVQRELKDGKKVESMREIYGFLENYSS